MSQYIWSPNWENVPGSMSALWVRLQRLQFGFLFIIPAHKLISSSICDQIASLVSCYCCLFCLVKLRVLLSLGLGWPGPSRVSTISRFLPRLIFGAASPALTAGSHSQSGQCPGRLEARSEACFALSLKPKQDYLFNFPNTSKLGI